MDHCTCTCIVLYMYICVLVATPPSVCDVIVVCPSASQVKPDYEFSEMVLYEVQLMQEAGLVHDSLKHIRSFEADISDRLMLLETKAAAALSLSDLKEAELYCRQLVHRNPENYHYYQQLEKCLKLGIFVAPL